MTDARTTLGYGYGRLRTLDPAKHDALWGARLIYSEVMEGMNGLVWDRQDYVGASELPAKERLDLAFHEWLQLVRREHHAYKLTSGSDRAYGLWYENVYTVGSPQSSFGYLYVSQAVFKPEAMPEAPPVIVVEEEVA